MTRVEFTKEMKQTHKILIPNMCNIHFQILKNVFIAYGYDVELLTNEGRSVVDEGLKYVHNDTCYPALLTTGQMIDALRSKQYDLNKVALLMTQTGGGCRASNYIHLIRKGLENAGLQHIPVISLNVSGLEKNGGFSLTLPIIRRAIAAIAYGDLLMLLDNQCKAYEVHKGVSGRLVEKWIVIISEQFVKRKGISARAMKQNVDNIIKDFERIEIQKEDKVRVGVVGEIYVKYSSLANNQLESFLSKQECEVMVPGLLGFILYTIDAGIDDIHIYGGSIHKQKIAQMVFHYLEKYETNILQPLKNTRFITPTPYHEMKQMVKGIIGYGCKMGEGWLLTAEMIELITHGYTNIVCAQPFGCLPNHISGKGMIRKIKALYPQANITPIDYDPGATIVNQENRIKLMLAIAREEMNKG